MFETVFFKQHEVAGGPLHASLPVAGPRLQHTPQGGHAPPVRAAGVRDPDPDPLGPTERILHVIGRWARMGDSYVLPHHRGTTICTALCTVVPSMQ